MGMNIMTHFLELMGNVLSDRDCAKEMFKLAILYREVITELIFHGQSDEKHRKAIKYLEKCITVIENQQRQREREQRQREREQHHCRQREREQCQREREATAALPRISQRFARF